MVDILNKNQEVKRKLEEELLYEKLINSMITDCLVTQIKITEGKKDAGGWEINPTRARRFTCNNCFVKELHYSDKCEFLMRIHKERKVPKCKENYLSQLGKGL